LESLLHGSDTVELGVDLVRHLPTVGPRVVDVLEQALIDWLTFYKDDVSPTRRGNAERIREVLHCLDCVVRKPFVNKELLAFPERCRLVTHGQ
jgi:hypothetical protein